MNVLLIRITLPASLFVLLLAGQVGCDEAIEQTDSSPNGATSSSSSPQTPEDAYAAIAFAVEKRDFGAMYDMMDSAYRRYWSMMVQVNRQQADRMDSVEGAKWKRLIGVEDMREAFIQYMTESPAWWSHYAGGYRHIRTDSLVMVITHHQNGVPMATYYRYEAGSYRMTPPPEAQVSAAMERVPRQRPPTE